MFTRRDLIAEYFRGIPSDAAADFAVLSVADQDLALKAWAADRQAQLVLNAADAQTEADRHAQLATDVAATASGL